MIRCDTSCHTWAIVQQWSFEQHNQANRAAVAVLVVNSRTQAPGSLSSVITCCSMLSRGTQANSHMRSVKSAPLHVLLMLFCGSGGFLAEKLPTAVLQVHMHTSVHTLFVNRAAPGLLLVVDRLYCKMQSEREAAREISEWSMQIHIRTHQAVRDPHGADHFLNRRQKAIIILALGRISRAYQEFYHSPIICCMVLA